jgi:DNA (cytosine-5)-methyltransferase 1
MTFVPVPAVAISENQRGEIVQTPYAHQLSTGGGKPGQGYPAVAYPLAMRGRADGAELEVGEANTYNSLRAADGGSSRQNALLTPDLTVRRLTPRECERLMGWADDWTKYADDGTVIADSHRYRMCGNGVVTPVTRWIGDRLP